ncbi:hypothetical protein [Mesorhizobium onobrychidis]|uniref:Alpha/beta hydrolase n=1 Tax=Mesorhizobium onobrychidis TaxID=2775404 RepID=A0ABY5R0Q1_9HYPH|nr:hypothetical protein [Mesorhizobium onobrychidis]UVC17056.1 hypothetical protein IHQ72_07965 [Mesorhizobium onobrychidis]
MGKSVSSHQQGLGWLADWPVLKSALDCEARAMVVLLSSGKTRDMNGTTPDAWLMRALTEALAVHGVVCINPRLPLREDGLTNTDEALIALRTDLASKALLEEHTRPVAVLAISLGTQSALALAARRHTASRIDALFLLSGVIENPVAPVGRIRSVDLIYGGRDHVGYLGHGEETLRDIEGPREYGPRSRNNLVTGPSTLSALHILAGAGHGLETAGSIGPNHREAVALLLPLVLHRLGLATPPDSKARKTEEIRS